jgi:hypothetical protein
LPTPVLLSRTILKIVGSFSLIIKKKAIPSGVTFLFWIASEGEMLLSECALILHARAPASAADKSKNRAPANAGAPSYTGDEELYDFAFSDTRVFLRPRYKDDVDIGRGFGRADGRNVVGGEDIAHHEQEKQHEHDRGIHILSLRIENGKHFGNLRKMLILTFYKKHFN